MDNSTYGKSAEAAQDTSAQTLLINSLFESTNIMMKRQRVISTEEDKCHVNGHPCSFSLT
jgi:hypothetical protein